MGSDAPSKLKFLVRALYDYETGNVCIIAADLGSPGHPAAIIDPVESRVESYEQLMKELGDLKLTHILQTHVRMHFPNAKTVISKACGAQADILVEGGDKIEIGNLVLEVKSTPGHTKGCVTYVTGKDAQLSRPFAFTGHSLLIRGCGRTDIEGGDAEELYKSVHSQIFALPPSTHILPGFDFNRAGHTLSTVREEIAHNPYFMKK